MGIDPDGTAPTVLILGVGNLLLGDDGVGVHVAQSLSTHPPVGLPAGTQIMDGGTFGLDLAPYLRGVERLVIIDAVEHRALPGHLQTWRGEDVARIFSHPMSVHQVGVDALLGAMQLLGSLPPEVIVVGVQPADVEPGVGLSDAVAQALPELRALVVAAARGATEAVAHRPTQSSA
ncbi:MAG: hydrogenase maturation protease [Candidatus Nanopelagicales bacterium]